MAISSSAIAGKVFHLRSRFRPMFRQTLTVICISQGSIGFSTSKRWMYLKTLKKTSCAASSASSVDPNSFMASEKRAVHTGR